MFKWIFSLGFVLIGFAIAATFYLQPSDFLGCSELPSEAEECSKSDAIVVISGGNTKARTEAGVKMLNNGWADYIVLSGAARDKSGPSNAAEMKRTALGMGVPEEKILIDELAETTKENAENTQDIFNNNNFKEIILVTSGYHQLRASLEFNEATDGVIVKNAPVYNDGDWGWWWFLTPRGWWLAVSETVKVLVFHIGNLR